jgi:hypothetical protein
MNTLAIRSILDEKVVGAVVTEHTDDGHFYRHVASGEVYPSVTGLIIVPEAAQIKIWAVRQGLEYLQRHWYVLRKSPEIPKENYDAALMAHRDSFTESGDIGTQIHNAVEKWLKTWIACGKRPDNILDFVPQNDVRVLFGARSAEKFCKDFNVEPIATEMFLVSQRYRFGGTFDFLCMIDGELTFVDWKSSNSADKPEYAMQTSAYWQMLFEMTGLRPKKILIVRLDKNSVKYEALKVEDRVRAFRAFKHSAKIYDWLNDGVSKLMPAYPKEVIKI